MKQINEIKRMQQLAGLVNENEGWMYSIGSYVITAQKKESPSIKGYISLSPNKDFTWLSPNVSDAIKFETEEEAKKFIETEDPNLYSQIKDEYNIIDITNYTYQTN